MKSNILILGGIAAFFLLGGAESLSGGISGGGGGKDDSKSTPIFNTNPNPIYTLPAPVVYQTPAPFLSESRLYQSPEPSPYIKEQMAKKEQTIIATYTALTVAKPTMSGTLSKDTYGGMSAYSTPASIITSGAFGGTYGNPIYSAPLAFYSTPSPIIQTPLAKKDGVNIPAASVLTNGSFGGSYSNPIYSAPAAFYTTPAPAATPKKSSGTQAPSKSYGGGNSAGSSPSLHSRMGVA